MEDGVKRGYTALETAKAELTGGRSRRGGFPRGPHDRDKSLRW